MKKMTKEELIALGEYNRRTCDLDNYHTLNEFLNLIRDWLEDCECEEQKEMLKRVKKEIEKLDGYEFGIYTYDYDFENYQLVQLIEE